VVLGEGILYIFFNNRALHRHLTTVVYLLVPFYFKVKNVGDTEWLKYVSPLLKLEG
jgi:hypothetical protein